MDMGSEISNEVEADNGGRESPRAHARAKMEMGNTSIVYKPLRSRARACEEFFDPAIANEIDSAVDYAMEQTKGSDKYRGVWRFYCLHLGINTFLDQLDSILSCKRQHEIRFPARAFHARLRYMKKQLDESRERVDVMRQKRRSGVSPLLKKVGHLAEAARTPLPR